MFALVIIFKSMYFQIFVYKTELIDCVFHLLFQLSLALADLALQMVAWKNAVQDLVQKYAANY